MQIDLSFSAGLAFFFFLTTLAFAFLYLKELKKKPKYDARIESLRKAIAEFERDSQTILRVERIDPDSVFLRSNAFR